MIIKFVQIITPEFIGHIYYLIINCVSNKIKTRLWQTYICSTQKISCGFNVRVILQRINRTIVKMNTRETGEEERERPHKHFRTIDFFHYF